ncbi:hypothetical protein GCM10023317_05960 [Actinopolymorpha pittospori]
MLLGESSAWSLSAGLANQPSRPVPLMDQLAALDVPVLVLVGSGNDLSYGASVDLGVSFEVIVSQSGKVADLVGWNSSTDLSLGPFTLGRDTSPTGSWTHSFGFSVGASPSPLGFTHYNTYTWLHSSPAARRYLV